MTKRARAEAPAERDVDELALVAVSEIGVEDRCGVLEGDAGRLDVDGGRGEPETDAHQPFAAGARRLGEPVERSGRRDRTLDAEVNDPGRAVEQEFAGAPAEPGEVGSDPRRPVAAFDGTREALSCRSADLGALPGGALVDGEHRFGNAETGEHRRPGGLGIGRRMRDGFAISGDPRRHRLQHARSDRARGERRGRVGRARGGGVDIDVFTDHDEGREGGMSVEGRCPRTLVGDDLHLIKGSPIEAEDLAPRCPAALDEDPGVRARHAETLRRGPVLDSVPGHQVAPERGPEHLEAVRKRMDGESRDLRQRFGRGGHRHGQGRGHAHRLELRCAGGGVNERDVLQRRRSGVCARPQLDAPARIPVRGRKGERVGHEGYLPGLRTLQGERHGDAGARPHRERDIVGFGGTALDEDDGALREGQGGHVVVRDHDRNGKDPAVRRVTRDLERVREAAFGRNGIVVVSDHHAHRLEGVPVASVEGER